MISKSQVKEMSIGKVQGHIGQKYRAKNHLERIYVIVNERFYKIRNAKMPLRKQSNQKIKINDNTD